MQTCTFLSFNTAETLELPFFFGKRKKCILRLQHWRTAVYFECWTALNLTSDCVIYWLWHLDWQLIFHATQPLLKITHTHTHAHTEGGEDVMSAYGGQPEGKRDQTTDIDEGESSYNKRTHKNTHGHTPVVTSWSCAATEIEWSGINSTVNPLHTHTVCSLDYKWKLITLKLRHLCWPASHLIHYYSAFKSK